jgi:MtN3 and saliva related transmembrane protein
MNILSIIVSISGTLMSIGHFPQAYKIYQNKSSKDVSMVTYSIFFIGSLIWLLYGLSIKETPIIISFSIAILGSGTVIILRFMYRTKKSNSAKTTSKKR